MSSVSKPNEHDEGLDAAVEQAIAICDGDIRALIVANNFLETEISELKKAVSHAYTRGHFRTYTG
ncbi:hypothetical protein OZ411_02585 [Bradyrhizobium sp. Arg237L]|uniref:hypothetical protein n=1 Tax=Bradyrhizobium sp. Arg237L TaxID=3003352 RepID=UPI00249F0FDD|nr:hypothetical protein [Bradyrhizobium sp. Arg237L]MDI4231697.1 hypothetical protein [Bradyrhizobium sp. Arg237L]